MEMYLNVEVEVILDLNVYPDVPTACNMVIEASDTEEARPIISTCALQYDINDRSMMISRQSGCLHYADTEVPECSQDAVQGLHRRRHAVTATHSAKYKIVSASNPSYTMLCSPHPHLCPSVYLLNTLSVSTVSDPMYAPEKSDTEPGISAASYYRKLPSSTSPSCS